MNQLSSPPPLYTPDDLLRMPDGDRYELIDGTLVGRKMGSRSCWAGGELYGLIREHCRAHRLGFVLPCDAGYQCFPTRPRLVRYADVSFIRFGRLPGDELPEGHLRTPPDLAAEIVSPNDTYSEVEQKLGEYLAVGVRLVWIVDPDARTAHAYRLDGSAARLRADQELTGEDVLPGFRCRVGDILLPLPSVDARPSA